MPNFEDDEEYANTAVNGALYGVTAGTGRSPFAPTRQEMDAERLDAEKWRAAGAGMTEVDYRTLPPAVPEVDYRTLPKAITAEPIKPGDRLADGSTYQPRTPQPATAPDPLEDKLIREWGLSRVAARAWIDKTYNRDTAVVDSPDENVRAQRAEYYRDVVKRKVAGVKLTAGEEEYLQRVQAARAAQGNGGAQPGWAEQGARKLAGPQRTTAGFDAYRAKRAKIEEQRRAYAAQKAEAARPKYGADLYRSTRPKGEYRGAMDSQLINWGWLDKAPALTPDEVRAKVERDRALYELKHPKMEDE